MKTLFKLLIIISLVASGVVTVTALGQQDTEKKEEPLYEVRTGIIEHNHQHQRIIVQTIDQGNSWLLITPRREVVGYLHKRLPNVEPDSLQKVSPLDDGLFNNNNSKFYYYGL